LKSNDPIAETVAGIGIEARAGMCFNPKIRENQWLKPSFAGNEK